MTRGLIFIFVTSSVPLLLAWIVVQGLRTGTIRARGGPVARTAHPFFYWLLITLYLGCILAFIYFFGKPALNAFHSGG